MNRSILASFALMAVACSSSSGDEKSASSADDLTGIGDLGALESSLGLVKDPQRTRSEELVVNGPCYQKLSASDRPWNMRRYTKGASFFYTNDDGEALDPVACVDLDVTTAGYPEPTLALSGVALDMALRFPMGVFKGAYVTVDSDGAGIRVLAFTNAALDIAIVPSNLEHTFGENVPSWENRGNLRTVAGAFVLPDSTPDVTRIFPHVANLAYRYAKDSGATTMAEDPIGHYISADLLPANAGALVNDVFHFERADITWQIVEVPNGKRFEYVTLGIKAPSHGYAGCSRPIDGEVHDFECYDQVGGKPWEVVLGHD